MREVGFEPELGPNLLLHAKNALPRRRHLVVVGDDARALRRYREAARQEIFRSAAASRVLDEAGLIVVRKGVDENPLAVERLDAERRVRIGDAVIQPATAANHE